MLPLLLHVLHTILAHTVHQIRTLYMLSVWTLYLSYIYRGYHNCFLKCFGGAPWNNSQGYNQTRIYTPFLYVIVIYGLSIVHFFFLCRPPHNHPWFTFTSITHQCLIDSQSHLSLCVIVSSCLEVKLLTDISETWIWYHICTYPDIL